MGELCGRKERMVRDWEKKNVKVPEPANTIVRIERK
jgi:DNA-binding transcriptional regulator YiaG